MENTCCPTHYVSFVLTIKSLLIYVLLDPVVDVLDTPRQLPVPFSIALLDSLLHQRLQSLHLVFGFREQSELVRLYCTRVDMRQ